MAQAKIVMLAGKGESTRIVYNALKEDFAIEKVIIEESVPRSTFIKRRMKRLGAAKVTGQILFQAVAYPALKRSSKKQIESILQSHSLSFQEIAAEKVVRVESVNSPETIAVLKEADADVILVNGTRIISEEVLTSVSVPFVNMHAGITPMYRGVHGAYWAMREQDKDNCGVTIHIVDKGVDTGNILEQEQIRIAEQDNFATYPYRQLAAGIPLLKKTLHQVAAGNLNIRPNPTGKSKLRTHPTLFEYLYHRVAKGVK